MARQKGARGNRLDDIQWVQECVRVAECLLRFSVNVREVEPETFKLGSLTIRPPKEEGGEFLVIIRASLEGRAFVGFTSGYDIGAALRLAIARVENGSMSWKEDQYA